jgi:hypothetical protein
MARRSVSVPVASLADGQQAWFESIFKERIAALLRLRIGLSRHENIHMYTIAIGGHFQE